MQRSHNHLRCYMLIAKESILECEHAKIFVQRCLQYTSVAACVDYVHATGWSVFKRIYGKLEISQEHVTITQCRIYPAQQQYVRAENEHIGQGTLLIAL